MTKHKRGGFYKCQIAPFVTNWSGTILEDKARKKVKVGDIVRVLIYTKNGDSNTRYVFITRDHGTYLTGYVDDPYNGSMRARCDECKKDFDYWLSDFYFCPECDFGKGYHLCAKKCYAKSKHVHKSCTGPMIKYPLRNGTIITFKRNCISEIPNWTKNTIRIGSEYETNVRRCFTGDWRFMM